MSGSYRRRGSRTDPSQHAAPPRSKTMASSIVQAVLESASAVGMDAVGLMQAADICPRELGDPEQRIAVSNYVRLLHLCEREPKSRDSLVHALQRRSVSPFGIVGYIIRHSPTVAAGFTAYERHPHLLTQLSRFRICTTDVTFSIDIGCLPPLSHIRLFNEGTAAMNHALVCTLIGAPVRLKHIEFPHARHRHSAWIEELFDAPAVYGTEGTVLHYTADVGRIAIPGADPMLCVLLERHARAMGARLRPAGMWSARTRDLLLAQHRQGKPASHALACELSMSPRTLQRRLSEEGTSIARLFDDVRRELALGYLADHAHSIADVSDMLGYANLSGFHRAFQRWTGSSPAAYRRRLLCRQERPDQLSAPPRKSHIEMARGAIS